MCENLKSYVVDSINKRIQDDTYLVEIVKNNHNIIIEKCKFSNSHELKDVCKKVYVKTDSKIDGYLCQTCNNHFCRGCAPMKFTNQNTCVSCYLNTAKQHFKKIECKICKGNLSIYLVVGNDTRSLFCLNCETLHSLEKGHVHF